MTLRKLARAVAEAARKEASTAASRRMRILAGPDGMHSVELAGRPIGMVAIDPSPYVPGAPRSNLSLFEPEYQGIGLGTKAYGEIMRRLPEGRLVSDKMLSANSMPLYRRMQRAPGSYSVVERPFAAMPREQYQQYWPAQGRDRFAPRFNVGEGGAPIFEASITPKALTAEPFPQGEVYTPRAMRIQGGSGDVFRSGRPVPFPSNDPRALAAERASLRGALNQPENAQLRADLENPQALRESLAKTPTPEGMSRLENAQNYRMQGKSVDQAVQQAIRNRGQGATLRYDLENLPALRDEVRGAVGKDKLDPLIERYNRASAARAEKMRADAPPPAAEAPAASVGEPAPTAAKKPVAPAAPERLLSPDEALKAESRQINERYSQPSRSPPDRGLGNRLDRWFPSEPPAPPPGGVEGGLDATPPRPSAAPAGEGAAAGRLQTMGRAGKSLLKGYLPLEAGMQMLGRTQAGKEMGEAIGNAAEPTLKKFDYGRGVVGRDLENNVLSEGAADNWVKAQDTLSNIGHTVMKPFEWGSQLVGKGLDLGSAAAHKIPGVGPAIDSAANFSPTQTLKDIAGKAFDIRRSFRR